MKRLILLLLSLWVTVGLWREVVFVGRIKTEWGRGVKKYFPEVKGCDSVFDESSDEQKYVYNYRCLGSRENK